MTVGHMLRGAAALVYVVAQPTPFAMSQEAEPSLRPTLPTAEPKVSTECGSAAGLYSGRGGKLWVTKRGTMVEDNPLRPLSRDDLVVLQVHVNRKLATAYGPDLDNLRQGGSPQALEQASGHPIVWGPEALPMPRSLRVVAEDGAVLLGPLEFQSCGTPPAVSTSTTAPPRATGQKPERRRPAPPRAAETPRPNLSLPQGAIR